MEPRVVVICEFGCDFEVSARQARTIRRSGQPPRCRRHAGDAPDIQITDTERRYWLRRYSDGEIAWLASVTFNLPFRPNVVAEARARIMPSREPAILTAAAPPAEVARLDEVA